MSTPLRKKIYTLDSRVGILWDAIPTVKRNNTVETSGKHLNDIKQINCAQKLTQHKNYRYNFASPTTKTITLYS